MEQNLEVKKWHFNILTNIPLEKAKEEYTALLLKNGMTHAMEKILVKNALGRVTAGPVYARISSPHYNASAMDGIALDAKLTYGASETTPVFLTKEQYVSVDTGDPLPEGCDTVVMIEDVIEAEDGSGGVAGVRLYQAAAPWQHVRQIGEDICAGEMLLPSYSVITPSAIGALLAGGVMEVDVVKKPAVGSSPQETRSSLQQRRRKRARSRNSILQYLARCSTPGELRPLPTPSSGTIRTGLSKRFSKRWTSATPSS
jgi:putative molybdopterin biosynthesis protein